MGKWEMVRLGDVSTGKVTNIVQKDLTDNEGEYPIYGASGLIKNVDFYREEHPYIGVVKDGAGVGRTTLMPAKSSLIGTMQYILPNDRVHASYLYYAISKMNLSKFHTGATIPHIYYKDYKSEQMPLPPLEEQQKIADILDRASTLVEKRNAQIEKLDLLVKSQFIAMFGDPITNPMGWDKKPFGITCDITTGNTPPRANAEYYGDYIEWIKTDNIAATDSMLTTASEYLSEKGFEKCRYVESGSILMTCIAGSLSSIGNVAITDRRVAFNQQINALTPKDYDYYFLYWLLKMMKVDIHNSVNMMLKGILSKGNLSEITAIMPPLDLQNLFATLVTEVEKSKTQMQQALAQQEMLYKSLMQKCFNGEVV